MGRPFGAVDRSRTDDLRITSASLYQLSYNGLILWCILQGICTQVWGKSIWLAIIAAPHNLLVWPLNFCGATTAMHIIRCANASKL